MWHSNEKPVTVSLFCGGMNARFAGFLAALAFTAHPRLPNLQNPLLPRKPVAWGMFLNDDRPSW